MENFIHRCTNVANVLKSTKYLNYKPLKIIIYIHNDIKIIIYLTTEII